MPALSVENPLFRRAVHLSEDGDAEYHLTVSFVLNRDTCMKKGYEISFTQLFLPRGRRRKRLHMLRKRRLLDDGGEVIRISGEDFEYGFSKRDGLCSIVFNGMSFWLLRCAST